MPSKTTTTGAVELLPRNTLRKSFVVQNEDATDIIYLKLERSENNTVSATDHDYRLPAGASLGLNSVQDGKEAIQGRWTAIASANTPRVSYFETEDIIR